MNTLRLPLETKEICRSACWVSPCQSSAFMRASWSAGVSTSR